MINYSVLLLGGFTNPDNDEAHLVYLKGEKEKTIFIGYSYKGSEEAINNKIKELK